MAHDVFISYASKDKVVADATCSALEQRGIRCWIAPRDVIAGVPYAEALIDALAAARMLVLIFTSSANSSPQVMREVERAVSKGIPIIPFRIENVIPSKSMEYFVSGTHWLDALSPPIEKHIETLASVVGMVLSRLPGQVPTPDDAPIFAANVGKRQLEPRSSTLSDATTTPSRPLMTRQGGLRAWHEPQAVEPSAVSATRTEMPPYFWEQAGKMIYADGSEQSFVGFRCLYSGRLYYSRNLESLGGGTYTSAPSIELAQIERVDFAEHSSPGVRRGTAHFRSGKTLENVFFFVEECSWWDDPGIQGKLSDPEVVALVLTS